MLPAPDCYRERTEIGPPAFGQPEVRFRYFPNSSPAKIRSGRPMSGPEALLRNIEYFSGATKTTTACDDKLGRLGASCWHCTSFALRHGVTRRIKPELRFGPKSKIKIQYPPDPGRDRPKTYDILKDMTVRTLPRDSPGGGEAKNKIKNRRERS